MEEEAKSSESNNQEYQAQDVQIDSGENTQEESTANDFAIEEQNNNVELVSVSPVEFASFDDTEQYLSENPKENLDILQDVKMHVTVELGRAKSSVKKVLELNKGSIVELNKVAGEQVELYANGKFIAYGEVIVIEDKFGLRVTNVSPQNVHNV